MKKNNAQEILNHVNAGIELLEEAKKMNYSDFHARYGYDGAIKEFGWSASSRAFNIDKIYSDLSIFDWWNNKLSLSQLKQMRAFLRQAINLGFTGYVCFKVGAAGCSHGMWAHKEETTDGYSPDGDVLFHSFRNGDCYWDMKLNDEWMHDKYATKEYRCPDFTLNQIRAELKGGA